jgi:hypothetical protein
MAKFIGTPIRGTDFASVSDEAISAKVASDTHARIRIDAGGRLTWGSGSSSGDINLYRDSASVLATDDILRAVSGLVTLTTNGTPTEALPNGAIAIDTTNNVFYYRSNDTWNQVTADGGNASLTVSDTPPLGPESGDLWFESDTGKTFVYYDSFWVEVGESGGYVLAESISGNAATATKLATARTISLIGDVSGSASFDGSSSVSISTSVQPNSIALGTDTTGNYMSGVSAGTGIAVSHTPGEGSTATISIESTAWTAYTPTITADGGGFALNNGTLTGRYKQVGKTVFFKLKFVFGSTTNAGTGHWNFSLPVTAYDSNYTFTAAILDNSVAWYGGIGNGNYTGSTSSFAVIIPGTNASVTTWASVGNGGPFIWGTDDNITISGSYEAA